MQYQPNHIFKGVVTHVGVMRKTATVTVERIVEHPKILKQMKRHKKYLVHDEGELARLDDQVTIIHGNRTSKRKAFRLHSIISRDTRKFPNEPIPTSIPHPSVKPSKLRKLLEKEAKTGSRRVEATGSGIILESLKVAELTKQEAIEAAQKPQT
ncbi:uncharacterized protein L203_105519 [Cryptococcus depauperatus CBS 7841]|uniref:Uncharacterized protein n=1 Tax=Cryptococcus depauperatus CBS 7841 TaxID=1295531 RepID=A0A1E3IEZ6_9TREE|nr:30S small subunit ribosomal protein S17 [Cryptococcus depauperatus CBS 7841]